MASGEGKTLDYTKLDAPPQLKDGAYAAESKTVEVTVGNKTLKIYTETVTPKGGQASQDILFLHGMRFSSKNWLEIKSVYHAANWGYCAVAVDLPGYGKSMNILAPEHNAEFMKSMISTLGLNRPVIVSPSMSGEFSLPYIFGDPKTATERATAFVPVAPQLTGSFIDQFRKSQMPTLIVVGTEDKVNGKESTQNLHNIPNSIYAPIEGASHPCYLDNPDAFHKMFYYFLNQIRA